MTNIKSPAGFTDEDTEALFDNRHILTTRTPNGFRQQVMDLFCKEENINYLKKLFKKMLMPGKALEYILEHIDEDVQNFGRGNLSGPGSDLIDSDPLARRGYASNSTSLWGEVKKLNIAFYYNRLHFVKDFRTYLDNKSSNMPEDDNESYAYRMFQADSLYSIPGLNKDSNPYWQVQEDRKLPKVMKYKWTDIPAGCGSGVALKYDAKTNSMVPIKESPPFPDYYRYTPPRYSNTVKKEGFTSGKPTKKENFNVSPSNIKPAGEQKFVYPRAGINEEDQEWEPGSSVMTAEQRLGQYYGTDKCESTVTFDKTDIGYSEETSGIAYGDLDAWGSNWNKNGGTRFMRIPKIPFNQDTRSRPYEKDIDETLGVGRLHDSDCQVRRWGDIDRLRVNNGETYRFNGPLQNSRP